MSFSRSFLRSAGLTDEQITAVMEEHTSIVEALKTQRDEYKAQAETVPSLKQELETLKGGEDYKARFEQEHKDFEAYKAQVKADNDLASVKAAYRKLLTEEKISDKRLDAVIRLTDFSAMKLDKDGNLEGADKLREAIRDEWSDYIVTEKTERENVATPPINHSNGKMTRDEIFKRDDHGRYVLSTEERQKAIAENPQAFR